MSAPKFFLPPYSPNFNPVEGLWLLFKVEGVTNVFFETFYRSVD
ncbi:transposase [Paenibacillus sp. PAMC21692]|nr:transposase [Paenibacillus sp. PAMC21692]